jgi:choline dehydrogenase-like flavoprotein
MNVGDERSVSCWMDIAPVIDAPPLTSNTECDVVVIGSGIAGLSTAYELARFGRSVIVIDRGGIGNGMTARTTGPPRDRARRLLFRADQDPERG